MTCRVLRLNFANDDVAPWTRVSKFSEARKAVHQTTCYTWPKAAANYRPNPSTL